MLKLLLSAQATPRALNGDRNGTERRKKAKRMKDGKCKGQSKTAKTPKDAGDTESGRKLQKTTQKLCKSCKYHTEIRFQDVEVACEYIVHTNKSRGDIIGWCDKYEKGKRKRNECKINMKNNMAFSVRKTYEV